MRENYPVVLIDLVSERNNHDELIKKGFYEEVKKLDERYIVLYSINSNLLFKKANEIKHNLGVYREYEMVFENRGALVKFEPIIVVSEDLNFLNTIENARKVLVYNEDKDIEDNDCIMTESWVDGVDIVNNFVEDIDFNSYRSWMEFDDEYIDLVINHTYIELLLPKNQFLNDYWKECTNRGFIIEHQIDLRDITFEAFLDEYDIVPLVNDYVCYSFSDDAFEEILKIAEQHGYEIVMVEVTIDHSDVHFTMMTMPLKRKELNGE